MQEPFDTSMLRKVMIRHRPGSDAPSDRSNSRLFKRVERLLCWVMMVCHPKECFVMCRFVPNSDPVGNDSCLHPVELDAADDVRALTAELDQLRSDPVRVNLQVE